MKKLITIFALVIVCLVAISCNSRKIDSGGTPPETAVKGELVLVDGNFRVNQVPAGDSFLLIWPKGYSRRTEGGELLILNADGQNVTRVGDTVIISGNRASAALAEKHVGPMLPEVSEGPYWRVEEVVSSSPASGHLTQERLNELAEIYRHRTELFDWAVYAEEHGITMKEAIGRFSLVDDAGLLGTVLEELEKETFAGLWLEHTTDDAEPPWTMLEEQEKETLARLWVDHPPPFQVVVAFTENGQETITEYVEEGSPLARRITVRTYEVSFEELSSAQKEVHQLLDGLGLSFGGSFIDVMNNRVVLLVTDGELFHDTLEKAGVKLPEYVIPDITYEPLDEAPSGLNPDPSVHFPQFKTRSGSFMEALMVGELVLEDGYLRIGGTLIIWQPDYFVHNNEGTIEILDRDGAVVGRVGEEIYMGGGESSRRPADVSLKEPLPGDIEGPFWIQGGGTRLNSNRE